MNDKENIISNLIKSLEQINVHDHLCLIYSSREEQLAAAIPFIRMGLERGEQCVYIVDENTSEVIKKAMRAEGIDVESAIMSGALKVITKREAYLNKGYFDPDLIIQFLKNAVNSAKKDGFSALRVTGEMTWALGDEAGVEHLIEYEAKLNYFFPENDALAICQYNRNRFKPEIIKEIIQTHPLVIHGYTVSKNFYYVPPDEFLKPKERQSSMELDRLLKNIRNYEHAWMALQESEEKYRNLVERSIDGILIIQDGLVKFANKRLAELWGGGVEELLETPMIDHIHPDERDKVMEHYKRRLANENIHPIYETVLLRKDGTAIHTEINANVIRYKGKPADLVVARDITELKQTEEELRKHRDHLDELIKERTAELNAKKEELQENQTVLLNLVEELNSATARLEATNKELQAFSYSVSHDLRAPLRAIEGFSQALLEDYRDKLDEQGKDYLNRVSAATKRMTQLIDAMLSLSRLTRGEMKPETVDLSALANSIAEELQKTQPDRKAEFIIAKGVTATGDTQMLRIVLDNLLSNAWKFTGKHPSARIEFGVKEIEGKPAYFVRDDGAGFDKAYSDKLFIAFQRLHTESEFPGIGIGLATVQRIIHRHGGRVWAEGEVEKGAAFYFTL